MTIFLYGSLGLSLAFSFLNLVFAPDIAVVAFPLSLIFGREDGQTLGLIFGIILSVLYWAATILGQMFGIRGGYNGFWMMWTPNFVLGLLGILLYLRLKKK